jgi:hypothetical protein
MDPLREKAVHDILYERSTQPTFDDSENTQGTWASYVCAYASVWALPFFAKKQYTFRQSMVKAAALCIAAIEWLDSCDGAACTIDADQALKVANSVPERKSDHAE